MTTRQNFESDGTPIFSGVERYRYFSDDSSIINTDHPYYHQYHHQYHQHQYQYSRYSLDSQVKYTVRRDLARNNNFAIVNAAAAMTESRNRNVVVVDANDIANQISDTTSTTATWIAYLNSATTTPKEYTSTVSPDTVGSTAVSTPKATCSSTDHIAGQRKIRSYQHQHQHQQQHQQQRRSPPPPDNDTSVAKCTNYERHQDNDDADDDHGGNIYCNLKKNCKRAEQENNHPPY